MEGGINEAGFDPVLTLILAVVTLLGAGGLVFMVSCIFDDRYGKNEGDE